MDAYVYNADLFCEQCGERIREALNKEGKAPEDPEDEKSYDSDDYPKGPYPDGGGDADAPVHCGSGEDCLGVETIGTMEEIPGIREPNHPLKVGLFLQNPLTRDGIRYVEEAVEDDPESPVVKLWADFYEIEIPEEEEGEDDEEPVCAECSCPKDDHDGGVGVCRNCKDDEDPCESFEEEE